MRKRSKRYRALAEKIDDKRVYPLDEAIQILKTCATETFDQSVDVSMKLGIDAKQSDQMVRGSVSLPKGTGKTVRVVAFCQGADVEAAREAGAIDAGADELIEKVQNGWLDFDVALAHPEMMPKVGRLGRTLGPKGLMPSPKSGTVVTDIPSAVGEFIGGKIEFRNDAGGNVHALVGKLSFDETDLAQNVRAFVGKIRSLRPSGTKGIFVHKVTLSTTMGPPVQVSVEE
ncbi:MAG TPA: 50S ribosomal protein L1 [Planctomycetota bacterium]|nr:50S ribosomal protein L1 [Planctomycetota bacterium]